MVHARGQAPFSFRKDYNRVMSKEKILGKLNPLYFEGIAHRGLWNASLTENGLKAFQNAIDHHTAFEYDIHLTKDGQLVVCHDDNLIRTTGKEGIIEELTLQQIKDGYRLLDGEEVPSFKELLSLNHEQVPMVCELKVHEANYAPLAKAAMLAFRKVENRANLWVISFDPRALLRIHATYGGTITASGMSITTSGTNSAAVATDRGGGTVTVTGTASSPCTLTTNGADSPCLYSTGTITATYCTGSAASSQAMVIEGSNVIKVENCTLSGKNRSSGAAVDWGAVMLYQSMSNDSVGGEPTLEVISSTITNLDSAAPMFYVTNAKATIYLQDSTFDNDGGNGQFLSTLTTRWTSTDETVIFYLANETLGAQSVNLANASTSVLSTNLYSSSVTWTNTGSGTLNASTSLSAAPTLPY